MGKNQGTQTKGPTVKKQISKAIKLKPVPQGKEALKLKFPLCEGETREEDEAISRHGSRRDDCIIDDGARRRHKDNHHDGMSRRGGRDNFSTQRTGQG